MLFPGIQEFRSGQNEIIQAVLQRKDVLAVLPTGGGKSLCYQYPSYKLNGLVVVVSPLIALMKDQVQSLKSKGLRAGALYSGQSFDEKREIFQEISQGGQYLLYLSPERVQKPGFQAWVKQRQILLFAIDEAHCVSQWGHDFRAEYVMLRELKVWRPDVPVLALTASATPTVLRDIATQLTLQKPERLVYGFYRPNLYYQVQVCEDDNEKFAYLKQALRQFPNGRVIIYCGTRKVVEQLYTELSYLDDGIAYYHAGLSPNQRTDVQNAYIDGRVRILIATNAFGMGIDQANVRLVVHFQMPANIDSLYQEMGRAGRNGDPATCLLLYSKKDKGLQSFFIESSEASKEIKSQRWDNLNALVAYSEGSECRHGEILTYYKDRQRTQDCGHCDNCDPTSSRKVFVAKAEIKPAKITVTRSKKKSKAKAEEEFLTSDQEQLYQRLKAWRKELARQKDIPAFIILGDKSLRQIAAYQPKNLSSLGQIYGVGDAKLNEFGLDILNLLNQQGFDN